MNEAMNFIGILAIFSALADSIGVVFSIKEFFDSGENGFEWTNGWPWLVAGVVMFAFACLIIVVFIVKLNRYRKWKKKMYQDD